MGDRPTTCHRKKAVRKSKLWPRHSQIEWNRPRHWKIINEMRIANWNLWTLYRAGVMNELVKEMGKYKVDICDLQEIGWHGN